MGCSVFTCGKSVRVSTDRHDRAPIFVVKKFSVLSIAVNVRWVCADNPHVRISTMSVRARPVHALPSVLPCVYGEPTLRRSASLA